MNTHKCIYCNNSGYKWDGDPCHGTDCLVICFCQKQKEKKVEKQNTQFNIDTFLAGMVVMGFLVLIMILTTRL